MKSLFTPAIWLAAVAVLLHTGLVAPSIAVINFALYATLVAGLLIAWRFHSSRVFFALLVLFLVERGISYFSSGHTASAVLAAVGLLLPIDFVLLSLQEEKGFSVPCIAPPLLLLFVESVVVAVMCRPALTAATRALRHSLQPQPLPAITLVAFAAAALMLVIRFLLFRKPVESGLLWALTASLLALHFGGSGRIPAAYFATGALVLAVSIVETSYLLAYQDELTTLPSRRAFHEALLRLEAPYSVAVVDIDHFKRCNDTYGHDTGDEVLRLVASRLARVTGGGQAYRCGGEEFSIIFPGKTTEEVLDHLEQLRVNIENSSFRLRGKDRRQESRGLDRRNPRVQARVQTGFAIRQLARVPPPIDLSVTASIGVASATPRNSSPDEVIRSADKALYRAKGAGRNRVETASSPRRRARSKTAGIA
ncbi:MAG: GGDEF domain-containing protein [Candidatus Sulfotelmatobacter sp.]